MSTETAIAFNIVGVVASFIILFNALRTPGKAGGAFLVVGLALLGLNVGLLLNNLGGAA